MSISCSSYAGDYGDFDWWWLYTLEPLPLRTKHSRKCCSCHEPIKPGDMSLEVQRFRGPKHDIEESIYGNDVPLAPWFMCEMCGDLALSLHELKFCFDLYSPLKEQIREYREQEDEYKQLPARKQHDQPIPSRPDRIREPLSSSAEMSGVSADKATIARQEKVSAG